MSVSQFTVYSSTDSGAPALNGLSGSLLNVLNGCLISGYGNKASAGWTKPLSDSGSRGAFTNSSGTACTLFVRDDTPNTNATEAWACGWEQITNLNGTMGTGINQFPLLAQQLTNGTVVIRKSANANSTAIYWRMYADPYTFYLFTLPDSTSPPGTYFGLWFGDMFGLAGASTDTFRCMIWGTENVLQGNTATYTHWDVIARALIDGNLTHGIWAARPWSGLGGSVNIIKYGDTVMVAALGTTSVAATGAMSALNQPDGSLFVAPIRVVDNPVNFIRGRLRGLYHVGHALGMVADGQNFQGANEFAGKTFQIVRAGPSSGYLAIETSNTVETN